MSARKSKPGAAEASGVSSVPREEIERRAYEIFSRRGGVPGDPTADWFQAERELHDEARARGRGVAGASGARTERRRQAPRTRV